MRTRPVFETGLIRYITKWHIYVQSSSPRMCMRFRKGRKSGGITLEPGSDWWNGARWNVKRNTLFRTHHSSSRGPHFWQPQPPNDFHIIRTAVHNPWIAANFKWSLSLNRHCSDAFIVQVHDSVIIISWSKFVSHHFLTDTRRRKSSGQFVKTLWVDGWHSFHNNFSDFFLLSFVDEAPATSHLHLLDVGVSYNPISVVFF